jgi:hypothetical protein
MNENDKVKVFDPETNRIIEMPAGELTERMVLIGDTDIFGPGFVHDFRDGAGPQMVLDALGNLAGEITEAGLDVRSCTLGFPKQMYFTFYRQEDAEYLVEVLNEGGEAIAQWTKIETDDGRGGKDDDYRVTFGCENLAEVYRRVHAWAEPILRESYRRYPDSEVPRII